MYTCNTLIYNELKNTQIRIRAYLPQKMVSNFVMNRFTKVFTYVRVYKTCSKKLSYYSIRFFNPMGG